MLAPRLRQACLRQRPLPPSSLSSAARQFCTTPTCTSKIGSTPVSLPPSVQLTMVAPRKARASARLSAMGTLKIEGPLGKLALTVPGYLKVDVDDTARKASVSVANARVREQREMWGTKRALLQNHVTGVSEGHIAILRLVGVGYRASIENNGTILNLKVGYSHPVELKIPEDVKASTPQPTRILLEGCDKVTVKQFAADIREWRKPEPYKGKGIFVNDETIKLKNRKIK